MLDFKQKAIGTIKNISGIKEFTIIDSKKSKSGNTVIMWEGGTIEIECEKLANEIMIECGLIMKAENKLKANELGTKHGIMICSDGVQRQVVIESNGDFSYFNLRDGKRFGRMISYSNGKLPKWITKECIIEILKN